MGKLIPYSVKIYDDAKHSSSRQLKNHFVTNDGAIKRYEMREEFFFLQIFFYSLYILSGLGVMDLK